MKNIRGTTSFILAVVIAVLLAPPSHAQECPAGTKSLEAYWTEQAKKGVKLSSDYKDFRDLLLRDTPTFTTRSQQDSSPSANGTDATVVNAAAFTNLLSAAFDQTAGNGDGDDNKGFTLNVNPFLLAVMMNNDIYYNPVTYLRSPYQYLRRVGGSVTFGGKGESFDRDGDGKADDALESKALDDIVTWEARVRFWGTRDRRENADEIFQDIDLTLQDKMKIKARGQLVLEQAVVPDQRDCVKESEWEKYKEIIDSPLREATRQNQKFVDKVAEIDRRLIVTGVVTGVERKKDFGPDKHAIGLRATWRDLNANFDWTHMNALTKGAKDIDEYRVGASYGTQILKGWSPKNSADPTTESEGWLKNGIDVSLSFALEIYDDTPDVKHTTTAKLQGKMEIPVTDGVRFPISLTWANHQDLLDDSDKIMGHFGVNVDTDKLLGLAKGLL